ncbi:P-loop containing nucleoside triphosphate hydrolase protein [Hortaea werneckii]|nr:P-loop containing nucleoside triphosphate hydrolase protein [Hortaea werneckii]
MSSAGSTVPKGRRLQNARCRWQIRLNWCPADVNELRQWHKKIHWAVSTVHAYGSLSAEFSQPPPIHIMCFCVRSSLHRSWHAHLKVQSILTAVRSCEGPSVSWHAARGTPSVPILNSFTSKGLEEGSVLKIQGNGFSRKATPSQILPPIWRMPGGHSRTCGNCCNQNLWTGLSQHIPTSLPRETNTKAETCQFLYIPGPKTVTGEDVLELHIHGGPAIVKAVLSAIPKCSSQSTSLGAIRLWVIHSLLRQSSNEGSREDQHFDESPSELCASVSKQVESLIGLLRVHSQNAVRGELLRNGIGIALLGAPNAGKSSLLNQIVGREAAIVSQEAGTTRDVVEVGLDLGGYFCRLGDTAGLRKAKQEALATRDPAAIIGEIEKEGMRRAKLRAAESDAVVVVLSFEPTTQGEVELHLDEEVVSTAAELVRERGNVVVAINKSDMVSSQALKSSVNQVLAALPGLDKRKIHTISCRQAEIAATEKQTDNASTGNIQSFLQGLIQHFSELTAAIAPDSENEGSADPSIWQDSLGATERHRLLLENAIRYLEAFIDEVDVPPTMQEEREADIVVAAEHLRGAADCLAKITGRGEGGDVEEVLGVVFEKFSIFQNVTKVLQHLSETEFQLVAYPRPSSFALWGVKGAL